MSTQQEDRVEVGECDLGKVFIFHFASADPSTNAPTRDFWRVVAGNHTIADVDSPERADKIANALCGDDRVTGEVATPLADEPAPEVEPEAEPESVPEPMPDPEPELAPENSPVEEAEGAPA